MRTLATLGLVATAIIYTSPAAAQDKPKPDAVHGAPAAPENKPDLEIYGTLLPFFENVGTSGATPLGTQSTAPQMVPTSTFSGINHDRRFRMTSGTSHFGFRGDLPIADDWLKLIWQIESPTPIDGEGPAFWASRNSHVGLTGLWGTLVYGNWDTPMKWVTVTSVNPIKGGYVADMVPIIGAPGASTPALNADPILLAAWQLPLNRAGFFRHEVNTVQYWSPTLAGFSLRLMVAANEHRTRGTPADGTRPLSEHGLNPYLLSGYVGFDTSWLRLRYSAEFHNDYFGTFNLGGATTPLSVPRSRDIGHLALAMVKINAGTPYETRLVATGDYLSWHTDTELPSIVTDVSRMAAYGLIQQHFGKHSIWVAGGHATEGKCTVSGGLPCETTGLSADYGTVGYLFSFTKDSGVYLIGYGLWNDLAARYSPFPILDSRVASLNFLPNIGEIAPGADTTGIGIGFVHTFNVGIFGKAQPAPAAKPKEAPAAQADKVAPAEKQEKEEDKGPPDTELPEKEETEEKPPEAPANP
jgi:hypothetical protein